MALKMNFEYGGITVKGGYLKLANVMIDNNKKTCSGELVFYSSSGQSQSFPVDMQRSFCGVSIGEGQDPRDVLYEHIVKITNYSNAVMI